MPSGDIESSGVAVQPTANAHADRAIDDLALEPGAQLVGADLRGRDLTHVDLSGADLSRADLTGAQLVGADLGGAMLFEADLAGANLMQADLSGADLTRARMDNAILGGAVLRNAILFDAQLPGAMLVGADLEGADLRSAVLSETRLRDAVLRSVSARGADLRGADLAGAEVDHADLSDTDLRQSRLRGLQGFTRARWIGADIVDVDFTGAYRIRRTVMDENYLHEFRSAGRGHEFAYQLWKLTSDCGRSLVRWTLVTLSVALSFAGLYRLVEIDYGDHETVISPLYFSVVTLTTLGYGDVLPASLPAQLLVLAQVLSGYFMLGGLLSIFATKMGRRAE